MYNQIKVSPNLRNINRKYGEESSVNYVRLFLIHSLIVESMRGLTMLDGIYDIL